MHVYFLLAAAFSTAIRGSPIAEAQFPSLDDLIAFVPQDLVPSFTPQDLVPSSDQGTYPDSFQPPISEAQNLQDFAAPDQGASQQPQSDPSSNMAPVANSQEKSIDVETDKYTRFDCSRGHSVCCQGPDHSIASKHKACSEKSDNQYAGYEDVSSPQDLRYGQYCHNPIYAVACDDSFFGVLRGTKGLTCYTTCLRPAAPPQDENDSTDV